MQVNHHLIARAKILQVTPPQSSTESVRTSVTDAGLEYLTGLANLGRVTFGDTKVTQDGLNVLRKALPNCRQIQPQP